MKKTLVFVALLCLSICSFAQVPFAYEDPQMDTYFSNQGNIPVIKGRLLNCTPEDIDTLSIRYMLVVPNPESQSTRYVNLKKDGSFEIKLDYAIPFQQIWLMLPYSFSQVIAHKGLHIEADLQEMRAYDQEHPESKERPPLFLKYSGPDASINQMVNQYIRFEPKELEKIYELQNKAHDYKAPIAEKMKAWDEAFQLKQEREIRFLKQNPFQQEAWVLENERQSEYYSYQFILHSKDNMSTVDSLAAALHHQPKLLSNDGRAYYAYFHMMLSFKYKMDILKGLAEINISPQKADLIKIIGAPQDLEDRTSYIEKILPTLQTPWCKQLLQAEFSRHQKQNQQINSALQNMSAKTTQTTLGKFVGSLSQGANLYTAEEQQIDSLVQRIRALYPQQAIILDVWATWCGPCISDMKNSRDSKKRLKDLPVKIVYLCVDKASSEEKWKKKIAELGLDGNHIWLNGKLSTDIMERYGLAGYPSYIFIDKTGKYHAKFISSIQYLDIEALKKKL